MCLFLSTKKSKRNFKVKLKVCWEMKELLFEKKKIKEQEVNKTRHHLVTNPLFRGDQDEETALRRL